MNTFNRFIIASFYLLALSAQTLALDFTQVTKNTTYILSDTQKTIRVTLDDYALVVNKNNRFFDENNNQIALHRFDDRSGVGTSITAHLKSGSNDYDFPFYKTWDLTLHSSTIAVIKNQGGKRFTIKTHYNSSGVYKSLFYGASINGAESPFIPQRTINLCWESCPVPATLTITSTNTFSANEKAASITHTLIASDTTATFSITENTSGFFSLSGTNNNTLTFNGTNTDFESATKSYTVKIKATTGDGDDKNTEQTITVTLNDLNDETPTAITLTGDRTIAENTSTGAELGTLSTTDADANDTFTYTSSNTKFTIDNNKLKLNTTLDYENATSLSTTITVTDANSHTFDKTFNFTVSDIDDTAPINILLSNVNLIKDQPANT
ncbi:cadherin repeat domain-containing protein, partial [Bathymodiolus thermophilus thioautotrophic gill symbiont]